MLSLRRASISPTRSAERLVRSLTARSKAARSAGDTTSASRWVNQARSARLLRRSARPACVSDRNDFAHVGAVGPPRHQLALLELGDRARHLGLVHVGVGAHRLAGHDAVLAEGDQHSPFRYANTVPAVDARQRLRDQAGQHIEAMGQETRRAAAAAPRMTRMPPAPGVSRTGPELIVDMHRAPARSSRFAPTATAHGREDGRRSCSAQRR